MLSNRLLVLLATAVAPVLWGSTYLTTTTFLLPHHPMLTATLRALPAGLILLIFVRRLPPRGWWGRSFVLGTLNITVFFGCIFVAADRLPGGVAAVIGGVQPLLVAVLAWRLVSDRIDAVIVGAGVVGVVGVGLIVLHADAALDPVGVGAALVGAVAMSTGTVLAKRWGGAEPPLATTSWQLIGGGVSLAVVTALFEPLPTAPPPLPAVLGYAYLALVGTALAYVLWFRGVALLPVRVPAFLGLLSPLVALLLGSTLAGEALTPAQICGLALVLGSVAAVVLDFPHRPPPAAHRRDRS